MELMQINTKIIIRDNPIDSPNFLKWQKNKRDLKNCKEESLTIKLLTEEKKNSKYRRWRKISRVYYNVSGNKPSLMLKRWFFDPS